jgi:predicted metal-dependent hydrolase
MPLQVHDIACLRAGLAYFRAADYFAAHDAWEEVWQGLRGRQRLFWQAMIQLTVGAYHYTNGNRCGCQGQWSKALEKCGRLGGVDDGPQRPTACLAAILEASLQAVADGEHPLPGIADFAANRVDEDWFQFS